MPRTRAVVTISVALLVTVAIIAITMIGRSSDNGQAQSPEAPTATAAPATTVPLPLPEEVGLPEGSVTTTSAYLPPQDYHGTIYLELTTELADPPLVSLIWGPVYRRFPVTAGGPVVWCFGKDDDIGPPITVASTGQVHATFGEGCPQGGQDGRRLWQRY